MLVTVGSHWPLTGPLTQDQRERMERTGLCMGCHQNMTDEDLWSKVNSPAFLDNEQHQDVMDQAVHALADFGLVRSPLPTVPDGGKRTGWSARTLPSESSSTTRVSPVSPRPA